MRNAHPPRSTDHPDAPRRGRAEQRLAALSAELREHRYGYAVLAIFAVAGTVFTPFLFPDAPAGLGPIGGLALGVHAAMCAVPDQFL